MINLSVRLVNKNILCHYKRLSPYQTRNWDWIGI